MLKKIRSSALARISARKNRPFADFGGEISGVRPVTHHVETFFFEFHSSFQKPKDSFLAVEKVVEIYGLPVDKLWTTCGQKGGKKIVAQFECKAL
jgi:hypothetical protein